MRSYRVPWLDFHRSQAMASVSPSVTGRTFQAWQFGQTVVQYRARPASANAICELVPAHPQAGQRYRGVSVTFPKAPSQPSPRAMPMNRTRFGPPAPRLAPPAGPRRHTALPGRNRGRGDRAAPAHVHADPENQDPFGAHDPPARPSASGCPASGRGGVLSRARGPSYTKSG